MLPFSFSPLFGLAGCGGGSQTLDAEALKKQAEAIDRCAAEGALLAATCPRGHTRGRSCASIRGRSEERRDRCRRAGNRQGEARRGSLGEDQHCSRPRRVVRAELAKLAKSPSAVSGVPSATHLEFEAERPGAGGVAVKRIFEVALGILAAASSFVAVGCRRIRRGGRAPREDRPSSSGWAGATTGGGSESRESRVVTRLSELPRPAGGDRVRRSLPRVSTSEAAGVAKRSKSPRLSSGDVASRATRDRARRGASAGGATQDLETHTVPWEAVLGYSTGASWSGTEPRPAELQRFFSSSGPSLLLSKNSGRRSGFRPANEIEARENLAAV